MPHPRTVTVVVLLACQAVACGGSAPRAQRAPSEGAGPRVAVLPARWITARADERLDSAAVMAEGLRAGGGLHIVDSSRTASVASTEPESCEEDLACVRRLGRRVGADHVVVTRLAELGSTLVIQVRMIDVGGGSGEQTRQRVVRSASGPRITGALESMGRELGRPWAPEPEPDTLWYERWWVWTVGAVVVAGAATAIVVVTVGDGQIEPDFVVTPP